MKSRTFGPVLLTCAAVLAAQVVAGVLFMGGLLLREAADPEPARPRVAVQRNQVDEAPPQAAVHGFFGQQGAVIDFNDDVFVGRPAGAVGAAGAPVGKEQLQALRGAAVPVADYQLNGPFTHDNLAVFLIRGPDTLKGQRLMPLQEALEQNLAVVHEGALAIDNRSEVPVFIQAGDIIKGGSQDRVLPYDHIIAAGKHQLRLNVFCVEAGRSGPRGNEISRSFQSSTEQLPGKQLNLAARYRHDQGAVWAGVQRLQQSLARNAGGSVQAPLSHTSLQLTLETQRVQNAIQAYLSELAPRTAGEPDVIGVAVAVNGQLQGADIYASSGMFRDLWPKLLKASAVAALAERQAGGAPAVPTVEKVQQFLAVGEMNGNARQERTATTLVLQQESAGVLLYETCDPARQNVVLHRSYLAK
jgi:hypothetical protein